MVHNLTLELDLEMVISILKDVVSAMAYVHKLGTGIAHQPLSSSKVCYVLTCAVSAMVALHDAAACISCHGD